MRFPAHIVGCLASLLATAVPSFAQCWTTGHLLQPARTNHAATSAGERAFFAGGGHPFVGYDATVNIYDSSLGPPSEPAAWSVENLSVARAQVAATSVAGKVLFAGGNHQGFSLPVSDVVDIYDYASGTWSVAALSEKRTADAATAVGGYALFGGGDPNTLGDPGPPSARVDVYDAATGTWSQATFYVPRLAVKATSVGPYALFGGGALFTFGSASDVVEVYDSTVGPPTDPAAWSVAHLSQPRTVGAATAVNGKAFFAGGIAEISPGMYQTVTTVDVYDSSVGPPSDPAAWSVTHLSAPRVFLSATSQGNEALFVGGVEFLSSGSSVYYDAVDVFDTTTENWNVEYLSVPRLAPATTTGPYTIVAGGEDDGWIWTPLDVVDARQAVDVASYCSAKTNSCGGTPAIGFSGAPSASASSGFLVTADGARQGKSGLVLYSDNGPISLPFQGGTLCVAPPLKRSVAVPSNGGSPGACDSAFALDWNAFSSGNAGGNPAGFLNVPGQRVNLQWWGRDSIANGSFLSDGLEYVACP